MRLPVLLLAGLLPLSVLAEGRALTAQQQRMKDCNARAASTAPKGEARRAFMKSCLSGGKVEVEFGPAGEAEALPVADALPAAPVVAAPSEADAKRAAFKRRLGPCIGQAKAQALTGEARKAFMSECLKTEPVSDAQATP